MNKRKNLKIRKNKENPCKNSCAAKCFSEGFFTPNQTSFRKEKISLTFLPLRLCNKKL